VTFLVSYFKRDDEAMYLASSEDGFAFEPVNGGEPVLRGEVGTRTLRDPFIGRGPDGRFHMLATDGWSSTSIVHASSVSLEEWSPQALAPVMRGVPGAQNAWAPEFFVDRETGLAQVIWSSVVDVGAGPRDWLAGSHEHRIWGSSTSDFQSFSPARLFFDPGYSVIDATVQPVADGYVMVFKDERGTNENSASHKRLVVTTFGKPGAGFTTPASVIGDGRLPFLVEGPSLFRRGDEWVLIFDFYLEGGYGALSTRDWMTWQPAEISLPPGMRHASVLSLPDSAWER
jgi:hypothetical protein